MPAKWMAAVGAALMLGACATVVRGSTEQIQFDSEPAGAIMRSTIISPCGGPCPNTTAQGGADGAPYGESDIKTTPEPGPACTTPCTAEVPRNRELMVTFSKPGYQDVTVPLKTKVAGAGAVGVAGNVIIGGAVGVVVDTASGAALDHYPNPLRVNLVPVAKPEPPHQGKKR
jgi:hypothetical protein